MYSATDNSLLLRALCDEFEVGDDALWEPVVVRNNDGGGIFRSLAICGQKDAFTEQAATPPGLEFQRAAALRGLQCLRPRTGTELRSALGGSVGSTPATITEVRIHCADTLALHRHLASAARAAIHS